MNTFDRLRRREYLTIAGGAAVSTTGLAGCLGTGDGNEGETGTLGTEITDQPGDIADFESCIVTIQGIWIKPGDDDDDTGADDNNDDDSDADGSNDDNSDADDNNDDNNDTDDEAIDEQDESDIDQGAGRRYLEFDEPQQADLVDLQGENTQLIDERELEVGTYGFLQLDIEQVEGTLTDGESVAVSTPGNAPLQFNQSFEIRAGQRTTFVGDFTPVRRGRTDRYLLRPVAQGTRVVYEDDDDGDEGDDENDE